MVQIFEFEEKWIIVWGLRLEATSAILGTTCFQPSEGQRTLFGRCWTGVKWSRQAIHAKTFPTREDAQQYLTQNLDVIELATV